MPPPTALLAHFPYCLINSSSFLEACQSQLLSWAGRWESLPTPQANDLLLYPFSLLHI